jgi:pheromone a factor receptor
MLTIPVGYNYGLPLSHFILAKQLENCTSLRSDSPLYDHNSKRRHLIFDLCLAIGGPIIGFLVSLTSRSSRFNIVEGFGPLAGVYWDTWGVVWVAVRSLPRELILRLTIRSSPLSSPSCASRTPVRLSVFTVENRPDYHRQSKSAGLDRSHFWRLMVLANAELGTCM